MPYCKNCGAYIGHARSCYECGWRRSLCYIDDGVQVTVETPPEPEIIMAADVQAAAAAASAEIAAQAADAAIAMANVTAATVIQDNNAALAEVVIEVAQMKDGVVQCQTFLSELRGLITSLHSRVETLEAATSTPPTPEVVVLEPAAPTPEMLNPAVEAARQEVQTGNPLAPRARRGIRLL